mmetsp:Transcript_10310/g.25574  ORF Transcript_10310/g.25574 Transcript_10310/m.25574 type:complete len:341 (-) Transcript_10310:541-1563(-)
MGRLLRRRELRGADGAACGGVPPLERGRLAAVGPRARRLECIRRGDGRQGERQRTLQRQPAGAGARGVRRGAPPLRLEGGRRGAAAGEGQDPLQPLRVLPAARRLACRREQREQRARARPLARQEPPAPRQGQLRRRERGGTRRRSGGPEEAEHHRAHLRGGAAGQGGEGEAQGLAAGRDPQLPDGLRLRAERGEREGGRRAPRAARARERRRRARPAAAEGEARRDPRGGGHLRGERGAQVDQRAARAHCRRRQGRDQAAQGGAERARAGAHGCGGEHGRRRRRRHEGGSHSLVRHLEPKWLRPPQQGGGVGHEGLPRVRLRRRRPQPERVVACRPLPG